MKLFYFYLIIFFIFYKIFTSKNTYFAKKVYTIINKSTGLNNVDEIISNLWLGNIISSTDRNFFIDNNIKTVINVSKDLPFINLHDIRKFRIPVNDDYTLKTGNILKSYKDKIIKIIDESLQKNNGVLVHCKAGSQRSATVIAIYLIYKLNMKKEDCYKLIKMKRGFSFFPVSNYDKVL